MKKPEPKTLSVVCSECELPWEQHGEKPTLEDCVRLLKAELQSARSRQRLWGTNGIVPFAPANVTMNS